MQVETNNSSSVFINSIGKDVVEQKNSSFDALLTQVNNTEEPIKKEEEDNNTQKLIDEIKTLILSAKNNDQSEYLEKLIEEIQNELNEKTPNKRKLKELAKELDHSIKQLKNASLGNKEMTQAQNMNLDDYFEPLDLETTTSRSQIQYLEEVLEELEDKIDDKTSPKEVLKELAKELETGMLNFKKEISGEISVDLNDDKEIDEKNRLKEEEKEHKKQSFPSSDWLKSIEEFKKEDSA